MIRSKNFQEKGKGGNKFSPIKFSLIHTAFSLYVCEQLQFWVKERDGTTNRKGLWVFISTLELTKSFQK